LEKVECDTAAASLQVYIQQKSQAENAGDCSELDTSASVEGAAEEAFSV
jgi:hypothetical protein